MRCGTSPWGSCGGAHRKSYANANECPSSAKAAPPFGVHPKMGTTGLRYRGAPPRLGVNLGDPPPVPLPSRRPFLVPPFLKQEKFEHMNSRRYRRRVTRWTPAFAASHAQTSAARAPLCCLSPRKELSSLACLCRNERLHHPVLLLRVDRTRAQRRVVGERVTWWRDDRL